MGRLDGLLAELRPRIAQVLSHPFIQKVASGDLRTEQLRSFALQYYLYCEHFPRCLAAVAANVPDDRTRLPLIRNLWEEHGDGVLRDSHRERYRRFLSGLGIAVTDDSEVECLPATRRYVTKLFELCRDGHFLKGLGALGPGTESYTADEYRLLYAGLTRYSFLTADDLEFFTVHISGDDTHASTILAVLEEWAGSEANVGLIRAGAILAIDLEAEFWDGLQESSLE